MTSTPGRMGAVQGEIRSIPHRKYSHQVNIRFREWGGVGPTRFKPAPYVVKHGQPSRNVLLEIPDNVEGVRRERGVGTGHIQDGVHLLQVGLVCPVKTMGLILHFNGGG